MEGGEDREGEKYLILEKAIAPTLLLMYVLMFGE
jgi:hypothetical protein